MPQIERHTINRMGLRGITEAQILKCFQHGKKIPSGKGAMKIRTNDVTIVVVGNFVVTCYPTTH
jgi:hypothetical protein